MGIEVEQGALPEPINFSLNYCKQMLNDEDLANILQKRFEFDLAHSVQIVLSKNNISEAGCILIGEFLSSFRRINSLTLNLEQFEYSSIIISNQFNYKNRDNVYIGSSINCIFDRITSFNNTLTCLRLNFNYINLTDNGLESLSLALCQYGNLRYLSLGLMANKISDSSLESFSRCLKNLKSITQLNLNLSKNQIEERGVNTLLSSIAKIQNMKQLSLDLRQNNLKCQGIKSIAEILPQLVNILIAHSKNVKTAPVQTNFNAQDANFHFYLIKVVRDAQNSVEVEHIQNQKQIVANHALVSIAAAVHKHNVLPAIKGFNQTNTPTNADLNASKGNIIIKDSVLTIDTGAIVYFNTSIEKERNKLVVIDEYGKVIIKSIPELEIITFYSVNNLLNCQVISEGRQNQQISCLLESLLLIVFDLYSGYIIQMKQLLNQQIGDVWIQVNSTLTAISASNIVFQYNFQTDQMAIIDQNSDNLNNIARVTDYLNKGDQYILTITQENKVYYYDSNYKKSLLIQEDQSFNISSLYIAYQTWAFYSNQYIYFYEINFQQTPVLLLNQTYAFQIQLILVSQFVLVLDLKNNPLQMFLVQGFQDIKDVSQFIPQQFQNVNCSLQQKNNLFFVTKDVLFIYEVINLNLIMKTKLELRNQVPCQETYFKVVNKEEKSYLISIIGQDYMVQDLSVSLQNEKTTFYSSEKINFFKQQTLFQQSFVDYFDAGTSNQIIELKGSGMAYQYDLSSRQIAKSFYFWNNFNYTDQNEVQGRKLYNLISVKEEEKIIITGMINGVLVIQEMDIYTNKILLENSFQEVDIHSDQINFFSRPFYIKSTKTVIVYIYNLYGESLYTETRQLHILQFSSELKKYIYKYSIKMLLSDVQVSQKTGDIICFYLVDLFTNIIYVFNAYQNAVPVFKTTYFYNMCSKQLGFFNLNQDGIFYSDFQKGTMLLSLSPQYNISVVSQDQYTQSLYISQNNKYKIYLTQPYSQAQIVSFDNNSVLQTFQTGIYLIAYKSFGNIVTVATNTYILVCYDGDKNILRKPKLTFLDYNDIQIARVNSNYQLQEVTNQENIYSYNYVQADDILTTKVLNLWELDLQFNLYDQQIRVFKYDKEIKQINYPFQMKTNDGQIIQESYQFYLKYDNTVFYYPSKNYFVIISGWDIIFIKLSSFEILMSYTQKVNYLKNVAYDIDIGYLVTFDDYLDCFFDLKNISKTCLTNNIVIEKSQPFGTLIQKSKMFAIFYSKNNIRVYSLLEQVYKANFSQNSIKPYSIYFANNVDQMIVAEYISQKFFILDLNTFQLQASLFPPFTQQTLEELYKFYFFQDLQSVMILTSYSNQFIIYDISTQTPQKLINLQYAFNNQAQFAVDENMGIVIFIDTKNQVEIVSYLTNQIIKTYQLAVYQNDGNAYIKALIWDFSKRKLLVSTYDLFYIFDYDNDIYLLKYQFKSYVKNVYVSYQKNMVYVSDFQQLSVYDYQIFGSNYYSNFPQTLSPSILIVNQNQYILFENSYSTIKNIVSGIVRDVLNYNNMNIGYFYYSFYDENKQSFYLITYNQFYIYQITQEKLQILYFEYLDSQIITLLSDSSNQLQFITQKQSFYSLKKNQQYPKLVILFEIENGVGNSLNINDNILIYSSIKYPNQWNKIDFQGNPQSSIQPKIDKNFISLNQTEQVLQILKIDNTTDLLILTNNQLQIFNIEKGIQKQILNSFSKQSKIYYDLQFSRIFQVDRKFGTNVYDMDLKIIQQNLASPGTKIIIQDQFVYIFSFNAVNIYLRDDLKLLSSINNFDNSLSLTNIKYSGYDQIFIFYFDKKISFYDVSPFYIAYEKDQLLVSNYTILSQNITQINSKIIRIDLSLVTQKGILSYRTDIYLQKKQQKYCSASFEIQASQNQNLIQQQQNHYLNLISKKGLYIQNINIQLNIQPDQAANLIFPYNSSNAIATNNSLFIQSSDLNNKIYLQNQDQSGQYAVLLQLFKFHLSLSKLKSQQYFFDTFWFQKLKILNLINIQLSDLDNKQIIFQNLEVLYIKNLLINQEETTLNTSNTSSVIKFSNLQNVNILNFTISQSQFNNNKIILEFLNVNNVTINIFQILNSSFKNPLISSSVNKIFSFQQVGYLSINQIILTGNTFENQQIIQMSQVSQVDIQNGQFTSNTWEFNITSLQFGILFNAADISIITMNQMGFFQNTISSQFSQPLLNFININKNLSLNSFNFSKFEISHTQKTNSYDFFLLECQGIKYAQISKIHITGSHQVGFISLSNYSNEEGNIIQNQMININQYTHQSIQINQHILSIKAMQLNLTQCLFESISSQQTKLDSSLIQIQVDKKLVVNQMVVKNIQLNQNNFAQILQSNFVLIQNSFFYGLQTENSCTVFKFIQINQLELLNNNFESSKSYLDAGSVMISDVTSAIINGCNFIENSSETGYGGALYCLNSVIDQFNNNNFTKNVADEGSGGAFFLDNCDILEMEDNTLSQNTALIGGGTRYVNKQPKVFSMQNYQQRLLKLSSNKFDENQAKLYGQNIGSYPVYMDVKNTFQDDNRRDIPLIQNVQSGNTSNPIIVRLIDEEMREIKFFKQSEVHLINPRIQQEYQNYLLSIESSDVGLQGDLVQKYDFERFGFIFNVTYSYKPNNSSQILIKSISKLPTLDSNSLNFNNQLHQIQLNLKFRQCQKGEVIQHFNNFQLCYKCQRGFYSLEDPHLKPNLQCQKCPEGSLDCYSNVIQLQNGYWRINEDSDILVQCKNSQYCKPEDSDNVNGCARGHFGVLCDSCDLNGQVWGQPYGRSYDGSVCQVCSNQFLSLSIGILTFLFFFIVVYLLFQAQKQYVYLQRQMSWYYLRKLGFLILHDNEIKPMATYIKILVNYFQFLSLLNSFGITTIDYLSFFQLSGGDPLQFTMYNLDCAYSYFISYLPLYGFRVVWANVQVIIIYFAVQIFNLIYSLFSSQRFSISTSSLTLVYLFYSSSMIKILTQSASCSLISGQYYIQLELNHQCYTSEHINLLQKIVVPLLFLWFLIIPLIFLSILIKSKRNLKNVNTINQYGYLYQDYKPEFFYWDIARNQFRALLVIILNILNISTYLKAQLLLIFVYFYLKIQSKVKPYLISQFNYLDKISSKLLILSILIISASYQNQNSHLQYIFQIIFLSLNVSYIILFILLVQAQPVSINQKSIDFNQKIYLFLAKIFPKQIFLSHYKSSNSDRMNYLWKKVKNSIKKIIQKEPKQKSSSQLSISQFRILTMGSQKSLLKSQTKLRTKSKKLSVKFD
ncbi:hypothetical protein ABPG73_010145 [Tetrahymena malaccensis]